MSSLKEIAEFVESVFRLDSDTPIQGYSGDPDNIGEANQQAQALANRTQWLKSQVDQLAKKLNEISDLKFVTSINEQTGDVTLSYLDVKAAAKEHTHLPADIKTDKDNQFVTQAEKEIWSSKQTKLASWNGEEGNIKTLFKKSLLGEGDLVFNVDDIEPSKDRQYTSQTEKDNWNAKQDALISGENFATVQGKNLLKEKNIELDYEDVGADKTGAAVDAIKSHIKEKDPHTQYLTKEKGLTHFVDKTMANQPSGFVQLDDKGKLPAEIADLYKAKYITVPNKEARLKIDPNNDIVICLQTDENLVYYLNPGEDPTVDENWIPGRHTDTGSVVSVFDRSGVIVAKAGDYNTEQITETKNKVFTTPTEKETWNAKQDALVSWNGEEGNLKTLNGDSLLGEGNIVIKSKQIVTDDNYQFVTASEKETWNKKQDALVSGKTIATLQGKDLLKEKEINLKYSDVGADKAGTATDAINDHIKEEDPHSQYLTKEKGDSYYLDKTLGNKENGFVQLDKNGKIPSTISEGIVGRYYRVADKEARLALDENNNILICLQIDENMTYFLNANLDPSEESNWLKGQKVENAVSSVFGRKGDVVAKAGDYDTSMITETFALSFVTSTDRENWDAKQAQLVSGKTIATLHGKTLLTDKDIQLTYTDVKAAPTTHTHIPSEIKTDTNNLFVTKAEKEGWDKKQTELTSGTNIKTLNNDSLLGKGNIEISLETLKAAPLVHEHYAKDIKTDDNFQFVSAEDKAAWDGKQTALKSGSNLSTVQGQSLLTGKDIELDYEDVGADKSGAAKSAIDTHVSQEDPHTQYLTKEKGNALYLDKTLGNQPGGFIQLDEKGNVPAYVADLYKAKYVTVPNTEERLKIKPGGDITICLQTDENIVYYLNGGDDPSVDENWIPGRHTDTGNIISVFGRSGNIEAKTGDYKTDQITETDDKTFVSAKDRTNWDSKQEHLVSWNGEEGNLKTLNNQNLLGEGNLKIDPDFVGAAPATHTHKYSDISTNQNYQFVSQTEKDTWDKKQDELKSGLTIKTINDASLLGSGDIDITVSTLGAAPLSHTHVPSDIKTDDKQQFVSETEKEEWSDKQDKLVSWTGEEGNLKTLNGVSLLGEGDIKITPDGIGAAHSSHTHSTADIKTDKDNQFVTQTDIDNWDGKQDKLVEKKNFSTVCGYSLLTGNDVGLKYSDVGADEKGAGEQAVKDHVAETDPHSQYLTKTKADGYYLDKTMGNKPSGFIQLDEKGNVPAYVADLYKAQYVTVANKEARLKIKPVGDITICLQTDENIVYYLNGGEDPSIDENWVKGRHTDTGNIVSVFGRSGVIEAKTGDYTADQITETKNKFFVTPVMKSTWDGKQEQLVSWTGKEGNLKTLNNESLLGKGNIEITPESIEAADAMHRHDPSDINYSGDQQFVSQTEKDTWNSKQDELVSGDTIATVFGQSLLSNKNITLANATDLSEKINDIILTGEGLTKTVDEEEKTITLSYDPATGRRTLNLGKLTANIPTLYYNIGFQYTGLNRFEIYRRGKIFQTRTEVIDYDAPEVPLKLSPITTHDENGRFPAGRKGTVVLTPSTDTVENYTSSALTESRFPEGTSTLNLSIDDNSAAVIPNFTSSSPGGGYTVSASSYYGDFQPWKAFQAPLTQSEQNQVPDRGCWSHNTTWNNRTGEVYLSISNTDFISLTEYRLQNYQSFYWGGLSASITAWKFQARNSQFEDWKTLDEQKEQSLISGEKNRWSVFPLMEKVSYLYYRILITDVDNNKNGRPSIPRLQFYCESGMLIKDKNDDYFTVSEDGHLVSTTVKNKLEFLHNQFIDTPALISTAFLTDHFPIKICTLDDGVVSLTPFAKQARIGSQFPISHQYLWGGLIDLDITEQYDQFAGNEIRIACTIDNKVFQVYKNNEWSKLSEKLEIDEDSAKTLLNIGMTCSEFQNIPHDSWSKLISSRINANLGIIFARNVDNKDQPITPKTISIPFTSIIGWECISTDQLRIFVEDQRRVTFIAKEDGEYKICFSPN